MRRREPIRYTSLTSLLDVLFILVFASLIHAAASVERAHGDAAETDDSVPLAADAGAPEVEFAAADAGPPPGRIDRDAGYAEPSRDQLYRQALAELAHAIEERNVTFARISVSGVLVSIEREASGDDERRLAVGAPLLERVPDPDQGVVYLGEGIPDLRICTIVRRHLGGDDLDGELVIIVPEVPLADLEVALVRGMRRDQERCLRDEGAIGVVVDPQRAVSEQPRRSR